MDPISWNNYPTSTTWVSLKNHLLNYFYWGYAMFYKNQDFSKKGYIIKKVGNYCSVRSTKYVCKFSVIVPAYFNWFGAKMFKHLLKTDCQKTRETLKLIWSHWRSWSFQKLCKNKYIFVFEILGPIGQVLSLQQSSAILYLKFFISFS